MLAALRRMHARGHLDQFDDFRDPQGFEQLMSRLARCRWLVYAKRPFREAHHVVAYLGRYTHRVAISNSRLVDVTSDTVTFRTKNGQTVTLPPAEFLRRLVLHVLPNGFHKIRHYGLYAGFHVQRSLLAARQLLEQCSEKRCGPQPSGAEVSPASWADQLRACTGRDVTRCPHCSAILHRRPIPPTGRAPPLARVA
jgi:hypothetical protein